jgi:hypothetical protein
MKSRTATVVQSLPLRQALFSKIDRVFTMTMITGEGPGIAKSPPWTEAWVGDSFRMRTKNIQ